MKRLVILSLLGIFSLLGLSSCSTCQAPRSNVQIIHGSPTGGPIPIYVLATYADLKAGGLSAGWFRGWSQAEYEFVRLDSSRRICVTGETRTCRRELPIALVAVPKSYLTGEIPGSLALYHVMSGTGDLIGGAGNLLSGIAWFRGIKVRFSGSPLATANATANGGTGGRGGSVSTVNNVTNTNSVNNNTGGNNGGHGNGGGHGAGNGGGGNGGGYGGGGHGSGGCTQGCSQH
jgi:hypothetical protein